MAIPLVGLGTLTLALWVIATAAAITDVMLYVSGVLHGLPFPINQLAGPVESLASGISRVCAKAEGLIDSWIGACWHLFAHYLDFMWHQFEAQAATVWNVANALVPIASFVHHIEGLAHHALHSIEAVLPRIRALEKEWHGIEHRVKTLERELARGIGHDLRTHIKGLEHDVDRIDHTVIPGIQQGLATAEGDLTDLEQWLGVKVGANTKAWSIALATTLLGAVGLGNLRCSNFTKLLGKFGCGLGTLLNDALGLLIAGLALESVCEFLPLIEAAFGAIVGPMTHLLNEVPLGSCEQTPKGWAALNVAAGPLPPAQTLGKLPS